MSTHSDNSIQLICVQSKGKLRIRFQSYTAEGKTYTNVYNNNFNCQFPRDIRQAGRRYEIDREDLILVAGSGGKTPFYRVKGPIRIVDGPPNATTTAGPASSSSTGKGRPTTKTTKKKTKPTSALAPPPVEERPANIFEVNECVICLSGCPSEIFIPCAHLCVCGDCYQALAKSTRQPTCPLCRRHIIKTILHVHEDS
jgi:hypothetical protein